MADFVISCCSTADMPQEFFDSRKIKYIPFHFTMDGKEYPDDLGKSYNYSDFYKRISEGATPVTSQVNVEEYIATFTPILEAGKDILHVCFSSGLSGSFNSANIAKNELSEKYPDRKIYIIDSLAASTGYGLLMDYVADLRDEGKSIDEIEQWILDNRLRVNHWFFSTDLTSYKRGGRISAASAMVGTILGICPLMDVNDEGHLIPREKIRTKKKVIKAIVDKMLESAEDGTNYSGKCFINNSACEADMNAVVSLIEEKFPNLKGKIYKTSIGTVIGTHTGPGTVALFFMGKERTR